MNAVTFNKASVKLAIALALTATVIAPTMSEANFGGEKGEGKHRQFIIERLAEEGVELPEGIEDFTREEMKAFIQESGVEFSKREMKKAHMKAKIIEHLQEEGIELPEGIEDFSKEEMKAFLDESGVELPPYLKKRGKMYQQKFIEKLQESGAELPEGIEDFSREEFKEWKDGEGAEVVKAFMLEKMPEPEVMIEKLQAKGVELPEGVEDYSKEDFYEYFKELREEKGFGKRGMKKMFRGGDARADA